jgi:DNA uptake protein ComE-like DNA-binding protein
MNNARITLGVLTLVAFAACSNGEKVDDDTSGMDSGMADMPGMSHSAAMGPLVNPNDATIPQLVAAGIDSATASLILSARPYKSMLDVEKVLTNKSETERDSIFSKTFIPIDLNKATPAEIETIPGVGPKMRHEFEEYRPWTSIGQFRREIGKYVDAAEVARLERFVVIR